MKGFLRGIEPNLLASSLVYVLAQALIRRSCPDCKVKKESSHIDATEFTAKGCSQCRNTGYRGRLGIYELMIVGESMRGLITGRSNSTLLRDDSIAKGMKQLSKAGEIKIMEWVTTREEVERVTMQRSRPSAAQNHCEKIVSRGGTLKKRIDTNLSELQNHIDNLSVIGG